MVNFEMKNDIGKPMLEPPPLKNAKVLHVKEGEEIVNEMIEHLQMVFDLGEDETEMGTKKKEKATNDWYENCKRVVKKMMREDKQDGVFLMNDAESRRAFLKQIVMQHMLDTLMMKDKIHVLNYIYGKEQDSLSLSPLEEEIKIYFVEKMITLRNLTGLAFYHGNSGTEKDIHIYVLNNHKTMWVPAQPEDKDDLIGSIEKKYTLTPADRRRLHSDIGFIGELNSELHKRMVFKIKDMRNPKSSGFIGEQAGKQKLKKIFDEVLGYEYADEIDKMELCVRMELVMRIYQEHKRENKIWFVDTETAIYSEFEKRKK
jgi:hypothetical protein